MRLLNMLYLLYRHLIDTIYMSLSDVFIYLIPNNNTNIYVVISLIILNDTIICINIEKLCLRRSVNITKSIRSTRVL